MGPGTATSMIPVLHENFDPVSLGVELLPHEVQILVFIDGETTVEGLAQLCGEAVEEVMASIQSLAQKGVIHVKESKRPRRASGYYSSMSLQEAAPAEGALNRSVPGLRSSGSRKSNRQQGESKRTGLSSLPSQHGISAAASGQYISRSSPEGSSHTRRSEWGSSSGIAPGLQRDGGSEGGHSQQPLELKERVTGRSETELSSPRWPSPTPAPQSNVEPEKSGSSSDHTKQPSVNKESEHSANVSSSNLHAPNQLDDSFEDLASILDAPKASSQGELRGKSSASWDNNPVRQASSEHPYPPGPPSKGGIPSLESVIPASLQWKEKLPPSSKPESTDSAEGEDSSATTNPEILSVSQGSSTSHVVDPFAFVEQPEAKGKDSFQGWSDDVWREDSSSTDSTLWEAETVGAASSSTWRSEEEPEGANNPTEPEVQVPKKLSRKEKVQEEVRRKKEQGENVDVALFEDDEELLSEDYIKKMLGDNVETDLVMEETRHASKVLSAFVRVTSSFQLYDPRNDAVRDALVGLFYSLSSFLKKYDVLPLTVEPWEFLYDNESVYRNRDREYSLSFKLFRDGVRGISFRKGIPWPELAKFLRILGVRYHGVHMFEDDIVSLIWKANFEYIETIAVEGFEESEDGYNPTEEAEQFLTKMLTQHKAQEELEQAGENQGYVWQSKRDLSEEDLTDLIRAVAPGDVVYEPVLESRALILQEEVDAERLPERVNRLLGYLEGEVCHATFPMPVDTLKNLVLEFRDYLITEERLEDLVALFHRVESWKSVESPSKENALLESELLDFVFGDEPEESTQTTVDPGEALKSVYFEFVESFAENRVVRRLLDASKLDESDEDVSEETYTILSMLPINTVDVLFSLLAEESYQNLRTVMRFMLVRLTNRDTQEFRRRMLTASPEFMLDLMYCLFMIRDEEAVEAIVAQISNPDPEVQSTVLKLMDRLIKESGDGLAVRDVISRLVESDEYEVRRRAYVLIEKSGDSRWAGPLLQIFEADPNRDSEELRQLARLASFVNPQQAKSVFLNYTKLPSRWTLSNTWGTPLRLASLAGLALVGDKESEESILSNLRKVGKENESVRKVCVAAMREVRRRQRGIDSDSLELELGSFASLDGLDNLFDLNVSMGEYSEQRAAEAAALEAQDKADEEQRKEREAELANVIGAKEVDVAEIQEQMLKALQHSTGGHVDFSGQLRRYGYELVLLLHMLVKTSRLYDHDNKIFEKPFDDIAALVERFIKELGEVALMTVDGSFYLNEVRVRLQRESADIGQELYEDLNRAGIGGITFSIGLTPEEWRAFVVLIVQKSQDTSTQDKLDELNSELGALGLKHHIELSGKLNYRIGEDENHTKIGQARTVLNAYVKANNATQSLWDSVSVGRIPNPLPVRHASNDFVDALANKEQVNPLEVLSLGEVDNPLNSHVLDTTMYSLMIGKEVGLSNVQLADLSMASFFHDVGFAVNPDEVVPWKSGNVALSHTRIGLRFLSKQQGFQDSKVKRLLAVVEHHMDAYQPEKSEFSPSLFSRALRVADVYSRLTKPLSELQQALSPPHALAILSGGKGKQFDPMLVQAFINSMGKYPSSTLMQLSDGSVVVSLGNDGDAISFDKPRVLVVRTPNGVPCEGPTIDLVQRGHELFVTNILPPSTDIPVQDIMARIIRDRVQIEKQVY